jgi:glycerol-3-phosphate cytidylyltransferase-like family protein
VQSLRQVDAAFVGSEGNFVESVRKARPDLVIFGHDQEAALEKRLKALGYAVERAPPFQRHRLSSTRLRSKKFVEKH